MMQFRRAAFGCPARTQQIGAHGSHQEKNADRLPKMDFPKESSMLRIRIR